MEKYQSLADFLGVDNIPKDDASITPSEPSLPPSSASGPPLVSLERVDIGKLTAREFAEILVNSIEFRRYLVFGLTLGNIPGFTSILGRVLDHLWGKAPDKLELTGQDGKPLEVVTEVRRVIVRHDTRNVFNEEPKRPEKVTTH